MDAAAGELLQQVLALPTQDRALLATGLLASLEDEPVEVVDEAEVERLWSAEAARRAAQFKAGEVELRTWQQVTGRIDRLRAATPTE